MAFDLADFGSPASGGTNASDRAARLGASLSGTNLARAGDYNQRVVLQAVRRNPDITRAEIARMTGLTAPTIANITGRLFEAELIVDAGRTQGLRGQPATRLQINPDGCFAIGLNIDRDHVTLVALDLAGTVRSRFTRQVAFAMPLEVCDIVRDGVDAIRTGGSIAIERVLGVGVALPDDLGRVAMPHRPADYADWDGLDVAALIGDVVPWSIHIDNDAAAAAIGEAQFGSGHDHSSFFYLLVSAGLGGGLVIDGSYVRGATARSGEIGFLPLEPGHAGGHAGGGVLQDLVSLSGLTARLEAAGFARGLDDPTVTLPTGSGAVVAAWIADAADALASPLIAVNCLINPAAVLVSGRLPDDVLDRLAVAAYERLRDRAGTLPATAPIRRATLSRDAPAVGAAILPFLDRMLPSDSILMK